MASATLWAILASGTTLAASTGTGSAYGLNVSAAVPILAPINVGPTPVVSGSAPPNFNLAQTVASVSATLTSVLAVNTGVINATTQSLLTQNSVQSTAQVDGLNVSILALALGANTVTSTATMSCNAGFPAVTGRTTIVGGTGTLAGITLPAPNTSISVLGGSGTVFLNEQIVTPTAITVNAIRIQVNVLGVLTASVTIAQSQASIADCRPTVTVDVAPIINLANQASYTVSGTCSAGSGNVTVTLPGATQQVVPCSAGGTWSATFDATGTPQGVVTVTATQTDGNGNVGTGTRNTLKDTIAPIVTVDTAPIINAANQATYSGVTGTCSEIGLPVTVTIGAISAGSPVCSGAGLWTAGTSNVSALPDGPVTVTATQTDAAGNTGSGTRGTTKDATSPTVTVVTAPPINVANQNSYSGVTGTCSENGLIVTVSIGSLSAPAPTCTANAWTAPSSNVSSLPNGVVVITASQTDTAGNTGSGTRNTSKNATAPTVTVTTAPIINAANQASYTGVAGACSENTLPVSVTVGGIAVSPSPTCTSGAWTAASVNVTSLAEGTVVVTATQTDAAGNTGSGTRNTSKNTGTPVVTVTVTVATAPNINQANQASYTGITGTCSENGLPVSVTIGTVAASSVPNCAAGAWSVAAGTNVTALADGVVVVTASQTSLTGNTGSGTRNTNKDATAPLVTVTTAPGINAANQATYSGVTGTCSENGSPVTVSVGSVAVAPSPTCASGAWSAAAVNVTALPQGTVTVAASQTDAFGNTGSGTLNTVKDTGLPVVTVTTAPVINFANQTNYTGVTGTCSENGLPVTVTVGSVSTASPTCNTNAWTAPSSNVSSLPNGVVPVTASQTDTAGNTGSGTRNTSKNTGTPVVTVTVATAPNINQANQASYTGVTGTCSENGLPVTISVGSVSATPSPTCAANAWTAPSANVTSLADGTVIVTASQTDAAGNVGSGTRNTIKDATAPAVTVTTAPIINFANQATYSGVTGTCSENGLPVTISIGSVNATASPTCAANAWTAPVTNVSSLADGTVIVTASQTDAAGNVGIGTRNTSKDSGAPIVTVVTTPPITAANQATYSGVTGTCSESVLPVTVSVGSVAATPSPMCIAGAWTAPTVNVTSLPEGVVLVTGSQTDAAGNTGSGSRNTVKSLTAALFSVSGFVLSDVDGLTNGVMDGPSTQLTDLNIYVVDAAGVVVDSTSVNVDGTYSVNNVPNGTYRVVLSTLGNQTLNPVRQLGGDWVYTSEGFGVAGDGTPDGIVYNVMVASADVSVLRFALERRPSGQSNVIGSLANPGGAAHMFVPARAFTTNATDPDGVVVGYKMAGFPSGADAIRIAGSAYTAATFPAGGVVVTAANAATVEVDPAGSDTGQSTVAIPFQVMDNANVLSSDTYTATLQMGAAAVVDTIVTVPVVSPLWLALMLVLSALIMLRKQRGLRGSR